jgi:hypothetical protein
MKVLLVTNPAADIGFRVAAEQMLGERAVSPEGLQSGLIRRYPRVSVVRGIQDRGAERWYAYRDGHWIDSGSD